MVMMKWLEEEEKRQDRQTGMGWFGIGLAQQKDFGMALGGGGATGTGTSSGSSRYLPLVPTSGTCPRRRAPYLACDWLEDVSGQSRHYRARSLETKAYVTADAQPGHVHTYLTLCLPKVGT